MPTLTTTVTSALGSGVTTTVTTTEATPDVVQAPVAPSEPENHPVRRTTHKNTISFGGITRHTTVTRTIDITRAQSNRML